MKIGRSAREEEEARRVLYPGTETLINKFDIHDAAELADIERRAVDIRLEEGLPQHARELTYGGFKAIHHHMFQDVYEWAGKERTYTTGRNIGAPFAVPEQIAPWIENRFELLKAENYLLDTPPAQFAECAAQHVNEINAAHPFIEGNGRVQRTWLRVLAANSGYDLTLKSEDRDAWYEASRIGFESLDHKPMESLLLSRLHERDRIQDQKTQEQQKQQMDEQNEAARAAYIAESRSQESEPPKDRAAYVKEQEEERNAREKQNRNPSHDDRDR